MPERKINSPKDLINFRRNIIEKKDPREPIIAVNVSTCSVALGALKVLETLEKELEKSGLKQKIRIKEVGCTGLCEQGPMIIIYPDELYYFKVKPEDVPEIISKTIKQKQIIDRLLYQDHATGKKVSHLDEIPSHKHQQKILTKNNGKIDPKKIEDYISVNGYTALSKALFEMQPEQIIEQIKTSKLRGRGGGGFPTGIKWETTRNAEDIPKYVIVNCDEGDPGAFMDRSLLEDNPHSILEGLIIGAYAIGAHEGYIYVREEYPIAAENVSIAIMQAKDHGLLGKNIMGSEFSFDVKVQRGAGAFVSGESSALMTAIEGKIGEPRPKYVHTAVKGLWGKPTCLNNVKTWASVPLIVIKGADWFKSIGTEGTSGTAIFSLVGKIRNTGLVEVPMGITLRDLIYKIGGGIKNDKKFKAVQTGGPSGGFIPEKYLDLQVDFDELDKVGSMMGSGGLVVIDEDTCMVDSARYFVDFLLEESCGKCIPCREGLRVLSKTLGDICEGKGEPNDIGIVEDISMTMENASLCALGTTAANPILTSLKYFREEWDQHIQERKCIAKACKSLTDYYIDPKECQACLICLRECPTKAIEGDKDQVHWINQEKCEKCGICYEVCKFDAVKKLSGEKIPPKPPKRMKPIRKGVQK
jgi:NADH:ubiquinone oxidoreductase subunit F (NADH-binding)/(2Fe-2S) ferredoxin/Pyruvate/2-oxoacid:ferredoxin oxidoreductase delta subunit